MNYNWYESVFLMWPIKQRKKENGKDEKMKREKKKKMIKSKSKFFARQMVSVKSNSANGDSTRKWRVKMALFRGLMVSLFVHFS